MSLLQTYFLKTRISKMEARIKTLKTLTADILQAAERCKTSNPGNYLTWIEQFDAFSNELRLLEIHLRFAREELKEIWVRSLTYRLVTHVGNFIHRFKRVK